MNLYHYYDRSVGPFRNLSDLPMEEAKAVLSRIRQEKPGSQSAGRDLQYVEHRRNCEEILRQEFVKKGGRMERRVPYYLVVEHSPWLSTWL